MSSSQAWVGSRTRQGSSSSRLIRKRRSTLNVWERIGANIHAAREVCGFTWEALGARSQLRGAQIAAIERGEVELNVVTLIQIATALRTTPLALLRGVRWDLNRLRLDVEPPGAPDY